MLPFKRILFPVDFSPQSCGAARYVEAFAGRFEAELTLLHVVELPRYNDLMPESPGQQRARLDSFLHKELEYFRVERITTEGEAATQILRVARQRHADLIMMPTHGLGPFRRFLIGSVAAKILHDADCPVWTGVHMESAPALEKIELHRVLCAIDTEPHAATVLASAKEFTGEYKAELNVVHVCESGESREAVQKLAGNQAVLFETGEIPQAVSAAASRLHADLLIIGRRGQTHTYPILRQSPCPVISV